MKEEWIWPIMKGWGELNDQNQPRTDTDNRIIMTIVIIEEKNQCTWRYSNGTTLSNLKNT